MDDFIGSTKLSEKEKIILKAACGVFSEKGYSAATTNEIAKQAGVAEGTIFRYFKTKKHILKGLLVQLIELVVDNLALSPIEKILLNPENKDVKEIIKEVIIDRMTLVKNNFPLFKVIVSEAIFHDDIREIVYNKLVNKAFVLFDSYYGKLVDEEKTREFPSSIVFSSMVGNIFMFIITRNLREEYSDISASDNLDKDIEILIDIIFNGIGNNIELGD